MNSLSQRLQESIRKRFLPHALILMYHRVAELELDPNLLAVSPHHFAEHMQVVRQMARPISLRDLAAALRGGSPPRRSVVITIDDGYADALEHALPLLERFDLPATVFVTSGAIGRGAEFWWDELERLVLQPPCLPRHLAIETAGCSLHWDMRAVTAFAQSDGLSHPDWNIEQPDDPGPRQALYRGLYSRLHDMLGRDRQAVLEELRSWAGAAPGARATHRTVSHGELNRLAENGLIEIGAHTVSHPPLAGLPAPEQQAEITRSRAQLETALQRPVTSFSYPHGSLTDETRALVQAAGFECACSSDTDAVWRGADLFRLPRVSMRDWDGDSFARWLRGWLGL